VSEMRDLSSKFENKNIDYNKLLDYGFELQDNNYILKTKIYDEQFEIIVNISNTEQTSKLIDLANDDEYILVDIQDSTGEFVGKVREEYENILDNIINKCTIPNIFKSEQAKKVIKYVKEKYNDDLEYLWKKFPNNAVWRNKENNKWYGALLIISESKLEIDSDKIVDIIDLRYQKESINKLIDNNRIFAGYHMNKDSWITIRLNGSMNIKEIYKLIDNSYNLSLEK